MATVSTTFTFSSTDISSDALSFTVSENLSLTGSGGVVRFNLAAKYTGSMEDPNMYGTRKGTNAYEVNQNIGGGYITHRPGTIVFDVPYVFVKMLLFLSGRPYFLKQTENLKFLYF